MIHLFMIATLFLSDVAGQKAWEIANSNDNSETIKIIKNAIPKAVSYLPPRQRQFIEMRYGRKMLMKDIADELCIDITTVSRTLKRAKTNLQKYLSLIINDKR